MNKLRVLKRHPVVCGAHDCMSYSFKVLMPYKKSGEKVLETPRLLTLSCEKCFVVSHYSVMDYPASGEQET